MVLLIKEINYLRWSKIMNTGDRVKILSGDFMGKFGKVKVRHFNVLPGEMKKIRAGVILTGKDNETLYSVRIDGEKENMYFPKNYLELISDKQYRDKNIMRLVLCDEWQRIYVFQSEVVYNRKKMPNIPIKTSITGIILYGLYNIFSIRGTIRTQNKFRLIQTSLKNPFLDSDQVLDDPNSIENLEERRSFNELSRQVDPMF